MLPKELIDKLPSMDDLLDHPQVRAATEKLNSSTIATRAREAFAHLTKEVSRQADGWRDASSSEFIDRLVGLMRQSEVSSMKRIINGTGRLHGYEGRLDLPMADSVKNSIVHHASHFTMANSLTDEVHALLKDLTSAKEALIASSYVTAHASIFACSKEVIIARLNVGNLDDETRLLDLAQECNLKIHEVGTASSVTVEELVSQASQAETESILIYLGPATIRSFADQNIDLGNAFEELKKSGARLVAAIGNSAPVDLPGSMGISHLSMQSAKNLGADLVLACGDGLMGGPALGLMVGETELINQCVAKLKQNRHMPSDYDVPILGETARLFQNLEQLPFSHPIMGLLDTPIENLKLRAERLVALLSTSGKITHVEVIEIDQPCFVEGAKLTKSWGVKIVAEGLASAVVDHESNKILGNQVEGAWSLDLRTIFPREDQAIVDCFCGKKSDSES